MLRELSDNSWRVGRFGIVELWLGLGADRFTASILTSFALITWVGLTAS